MKRLKACVLGHPVGHSKSPLIHQYWLKKYGMEGSYDAVDVTLHDLESCVQKLVAEHYNGFNVTVPYKEKILKLCDTLDETAQKIGAVNAVKIENKKLIGMNSDAFGFIENLKAHAKDFDFTRAPACVLGAGGAARAVLYGLLENGVPEIFLSNRTMQKAQALQKEFGNKIKVIEWDCREEALDGIGLLVNATSLGLKGGKPLELSLETLAQNAYVYDLVYAPLYTHLLSDAQHRGHHIITGIGMLLHQARLAFHAWTDIMPDVTGDLEELVLS